MPADAPLLIDVTRLVWRRWKGRLPTGIDRVCLAYLNHFGPRAQAVVQHKYFRRVLGRGASQDLFQLLLAPTEGFRTKLLSGAFRNLGDLNGKGANRLYLNVGHTGLNSEGFRDWVSRSDVRPVYLIHDLIPITHPQFCRVGEDERHRDRMRTVLATAKGVIGNSKATLDELVQFAASEQLPVPKTLAAWLGIDYPAALSAPAPTTRPTFIVLGTIEGRKNHLLLLRVWSRLIERLGKNAPKLLIIGQRGWEASDVFELLDRDETLRGHVTELDRCSDEELAAHLASARALLFPSFTEGYGLPMVEALAAGVPVIASDLPVFRELFGNIPTYLDPLEDLDWEAMIVDYSDPHSTERHAQCLRMKDYNAPTWGEHFDRVEDWLQTLD